MRMLPLALIFCSMTALAHQLKVQVLTNKGKPMNNVVVYALSEKASTMTPSLTVSIMDQKNQQFVPHILPIQTGTQVEFPNSDSIKHHVYSFSEANTFELKLYKGQAPKPIDFPKHGVIEMGCNVHDWMLGYIFAVDTPYFKKTSPSGETVLDLPEDEYSIKFWHPRIRDNDLTQVKVVTLSANRELVFEIKEDLYPDLSGYEDTDENNYD